MIVNDGPERVAPPEANAPIYKGDKMPLARRHLPEILPADIARFYESVVIGENSECWPWKNRNDYGQFSLGNHNYGVHRISYFLATGEDPYPLMICHTCDNPPCMNPLHLFPGDLLDNTLDCIQKHRYPLAKLTPETAEQIRIMYSSGKYTQKEVGAAFGVSSRTINCLLVGRTWKYFGTIRHPRPKRVRHMESYRFHVDPSLQYGEKSYTAKLTNAKVLEIRQRRLNGEKLQSIADCMGVHIVTVHNVVQRKTWKHI